MLLSYTDELEAKVRELDDLRANERNLVERDRFNGVCLELENALEREKKAQRILVDQNDKLQVSIYVAEYAMHK